MIIKSEGHPLQFLFSALVRSPFWAITPEGALRALAVLQAKPGDLLSTWEAARPALQGKAGNKVALIPIQGVLSKDGPAWYGSNYDTIGRAVEDAAANPEVKRIVLSVDSPGGEVTGLPETAAVLAAARQMKPISAMVEGMAASAAYYLASQANDIIVTPSGEVGSVGVRMMHVDVSKALDDWGYKVTELYSGNFKTEWSPYKPLSEEAKADMQPRLEAAHQEFLNAITSARGERVTDQIREARFGEGRMFSAQVAMSNGMVDKIQPTRDYYKALMPAQEESTPGFPIRAHLAHELRKRGRQV